MSDVIRGSHREVPSVEMDSIPSSYEDFVRPRMYQPMLRDLLLAPGYNDQQFDALPNVEPRNDRGMSPLPEGHPGYNPLTPLPKTRTI